MWGTGGSVEERGRRGRKLVKSVSVRLGSREYVGIAFFVRVGLVRAVDEKGGEALVKIVFMRGGWWLERSAFFGRR